MLQINQTTTTAGQTEPRIAFIQACWHRDIVDQARDSFAAKIEKHGIAPDRVDYFEVPGAFEIPLRAKLLSKSNQYAPSSTRPWWWTAVSIATNSSPAL